MKVKRAAKNFRPCGKHAVFLQKNRDLFPQGSLPAHPARLAALAVKIYKLFSDTRTNNGSSAMSDRVTAQAIFTALNQTESGDSIGPRRTVSKPTEKA